jgi:hypothetical protein
MTPPERAARGLHVTDKEWQAFRIAELDARVVEIKAACTPDTLLPWEKEKAIRDERDALRLRVLELEAEINQRIDAAVDRAAVRRSARPVGRPRKTRAK